MVNKDFLNIQLSPLRVTKFYQTRELTNNDLKIKKKQSQTKQHEKSGKGLR